MSLKSVAKAKKKTHITITESVPNQAHTNSSIEIKAADDSPDSSVPPSERSTFESYQLGAVIHRDEEGIVYRASKQDCSERLAVKVFHKAITDPLEMEKFQQVAEAASSWSHTSVARIHDFGLSDSGKRFVVTDELQGSSLQQILAREKRLGKERALKLFLQISDAMGYISWTNSVVGDLCSENIFCTRETEGIEIAKLVNIGLNIEQHEIYGMPPSGAFVRYASPERCSGQDPDERSAIYSVGCLMFESLAGKPPFEGVTDLDVIEKHLRTKPASLFKGAYKEGHNRDKKLEEIVAKCLAKNPADRYQTFNELAAELEFALNLKTPVDTLLSHSRISKEAFAELLIAVMAITITVLSVQFMVKDYNGRLRELKKTIAEAQTANESDSDIEQTRKLWDEAILKAKLLHQPRAVIADLYVTKQLANGLVSPESEKDLMTALSIYDSERLVYEANQTLNHLYGYFQLSCVHEVKPGQPYNRIDPASAKKFQNILWRYYDYSRRTYGIENSHDIVALTSTILIQNGNYLSAEKILKEFLNACPIDDRPYKHEWMLADCLKRQGHLTQALIWYRRAMDDAYLQHLNDVADESTHQRRADLLAISDDYTDVLEQLGRTKEKQQFLGKMREIEQTANGQAISPEPVHSSGTFFHVGTPSPGHSVGLQDAFTDN